MYINDTPTIMQQYKQIIFCPKHYLCSVELGKAAHSPRFFLLCHFKLAQTIRLDLHILAISIQDTQHKISLCADDVLLVFFFLTNIPKSLPQILKVFTQFSLFSGYKTLLIPLYAPAKHFILPSI